MSSRPLIKPYSVIVNGDMSTNITSDATIVQNLSMVSYDVSWSGASPVGEMSVQVSNTYALDPGGDVKVAGNWTTLTLTGSTAVSGNSGNGAINVPNNGFYAIRLVYTRTSGTGTMQAVLNAKVQ